MTEEDTATDAAPTESAQEYDADLVAAVTAAQLSVCTEVVPAALELRLAAAAALPAGAWRRTAGHDDPRVTELEAPHRRLAVTTPGDEAPARRQTRKASTSSGSRRRRSTTTKKGK